MTRAAVVIINRANQVALIERRLGGSIYYLFPGGAIQENETPSQAAAREALEELGVQVDVGALLAEIRFRGNEQYYFEGNIVGGRFGTGTPGSRLESVAGTYAAVWKSISELPGLDARPRVLCNALSEIAASGSPAEVIRSVEG